jgi:phosphoheptose isomerase
VSSQSAPGSDHLKELIRVLSDSAVCGRAETWGQKLVACFERGNKLLVAGNGGSAAEAQHLTAELVGRFKDERHPLPAIALHGDTSSLTAIGNDYGFESVFARPVTALAQPRDVVVLLSTSGRSPNILAAAVAARRVGAAVWAMTGRAPNPLAAAADEVVAVDSHDNAVVQEVHLVFVHLTATAVDVALKASSGQYEAMTA